MRGERESTTVPTDDGHIPQGSFTVANDELLRELLKKHINYNIKPADRNILYIFYLFRPAYMIFAFFLP